VLENWQRVSAQLTGCQLCVQREAAASASALYLISIDIYHYLSDVIRSECSAALQPSLCTPLHQSALYLSCILAPPALPSFKGMVVHAFSSIIRAGRPCTHTSEQ